MKSTEQQFVEFYEENADSLFRYCSFRVDEREVAIDLVQDAFGKVWLYISSGNQIGNMRAFIYKTLNNLIIDYYRKKKAESLDNLFEAGIDFADDNVKISADQIDARSAVELIKKLPQEYRDVLFMKYVSDLSLSEIADIVGERENTIAVRIHRGIKKLKELYI